MKLLPVSASPPRVRAKNDFTHFTRQQEQENAEQIGDDDAGLLTVVLVELVVVVSRRRRRCRGRGDDVVALTHSTSTPDGGVRLNIACMQ